MRLSGWQRIGVIPVSYLVHWICRYVWHADRKEKADFYVSQLNTCSNIWDTEAESFKYIEEEWSR